MDLPSPTRRTVTVLATATVGAVVAVPVLDALVSGGDGRDPGATGPTGSSARLADGRTGLALAPQPGGVRAADVRLESLAVGSARRSTGTPVLETGIVETESFSMVGLTWRGDEVAVEVRTRPVGSSGWTPWSPLRPLHDGPDPGGGEGDPTLRATELTWVGPSDGLQVRSSGAATGAALALIEPEVLAARTLLRSSARRRRRRRNRSLRPRIRGRRDWGADDRLRSGKPTIDSTIRQMHVHHTVNSNSYARRDVAGLIRGMYRYHTQNLGWSDLGYNFLVDRFGRIWVGRAGGPGRPVRGAHTLGFNTDSFGVAVIGNFEAGPANRRIVRGLARIAAWKLHRHGRHPRGSVRVTSSGSDRHRSGTRVRLRVIDGHRDTNQTACPGSALYRRLPRVRRRAAARIQRLG